MSVAANTSEKTAAEIKQFPAPALPEPAAEAPAIAPAASAALTPPAAARKRGRKGRFFMMAVAPLALAVKRRTGMSRSLGSPLTRLTSSNPSISGIITSETMTSGRFAAIDSSASRPFVARTISCPVDRMSAR